MFMRTSRLRQLEEEVANLQRQLDAIACQLGILPNPPRRGWKRYSSPIDMDVSTRSTKIMSIVKPDGEIADITIDQFDYVRVYDKNGRELLQYCGPAHLVAHHLRQRAPHVPKWLPVYVRPSDPIAAPNTPIPAFDKNLV